MMYVKTKRDGGFVLLRYDQIRSDFMQPLVRECRGVILDESDEYRPVCVPFFKFGNYGESYVPDIDWSSAVVQEEFLSYFPEYSGVFGKLTDKIAAFAERQDKLFAEIAAVKYETRKDLAAVVTKTECPACLFALLDSKEQRARDWLMSRSADKILQMLGLAAE
ncbi:MAG: hypothetical protein LBK75_08390 [Oscillospiraceae bacterium]|nr:hypothetical protein [Oscillospiraceae bacterium]